MMRAIFAAAFLLSVSAGTGYAADCERYEYGSQAWWKCQSQYGPD